jgi:hypothetical protein
MCVGALYYLRALRAWISWSSGGARGGCKTHRSGVRNRVEQNTFLTPHTGTLLESQYHSCVRKFAFRFGEVALRAPPNGNRQRRLSSCSPQCPSYPLPGDYYYYIILYIGVLFQYGSDGEEDTVVSCLVHSHSHTLLPALRCVVISNAVLNLPAIPGIHHTSSCLPVSLSSSCTHTGGVIVRFAGPK